MAVDNRDFADHFELDGSNVYVEDKRIGELKDATAKTASQVSITDQYVPLQDTDGNIVKISPASFQEALRVELGKLLANNDKGTTISGVPALSGSGNSLDFGSITPANLASVLGVIKIKQFRYDNTSSNTGLSSDAGIVWIQSYSFGEGYLFYCDGSKFVVVEKTGTAGAVPTLTIQNGKIYISATSIGMIYRFE